MHVLNGLTSLRTGIEDDPVARAVNAGGCGDQVYLGRDLVKQPGARAG